MLSSPNFKVTTMQDKELFHSDYTIYQISENSFNFDSEELLNFYTQHLKIEPTEKLRIKKLLSISKNNILEIITNNGLMFTEDKLEVINAIFSNVKSLDKNLKDLKKAMPSQKDLADIYWKIRDTLNGLFLITETLRINANQSAKYNAEIICNLIPVFEVLILTILAFTKISLTINPALANLYIFLHHDLAAFCQKIVDSYKNLQHQRLSIKGKRFFWVDEWNKAQPVLYEKNCCAKLEIIQDLSCYWSLLLDGQHEVKVSRASMPKFPHLFDESQRLGVYEYEANLPEEIKFTDLENVLIYAADNNLLRNQQINAYIARDNNTKNLIATLAKLLTDAQYNFVFRRVANLLETIGNSKHTIPSFVNSNEHQAKVLQDFMQANTKACENTLENLQLTYQRLPINLKSQLLIQAIIANQANWVKFCFKNGGSIYATNADGIDVALIALSANQITRGTVLDQILTLSRDELQNIKGLQAQSFSEFIDSQTNNTILHEILLRKNSAQVFFEFYCPTNLKYILFHKNNDGHTIYKLAKQAELKSIISRYRREIFTQAMRENDTEIVEFYLQAGGNPNATADSTHPLAIIWKNLAKNDSDVLEILQIMLAYKCDLTTQISKQHNIHDLICAELSQRGMRSRFFIENQDNYKEALKIIHTFQAIKQQSSIVADVQESIQETWLTSSFKPELQVLKYNCLLVMLAQLTIDPENTQACLLSLFILIGTLMLENYQLPTKVSSYQYAHNEHLDSQSEVTLLRK